MTFDPMRQQPSEVVCYVNSKCNAKCSFCLRQKEGYVPTPDLTAETLAKVLDAFPRITSACIAGFGEPLMAKTLPELLELCAERNVYSGVITNGALIDDVCDEVPLHLANQVTISVNAWDAESHSASFRLPDMYDRVAAGVDVLGQLRVPVLASFVVGKSNVHQLAGMLNYALDLGITDVYVVNELYHGDHHDTKEVQRWVHDNVITFDDNEALAAIDNARKEAESLGVNVAVWPQPIQPGSNPRRCLSPFTRIGVDGNGDVTGCIRITPPSSTTGNIDKQGPLVWALSPQMRRLRDGLAGVGPLAPECRYCFGAWIKG